MSRGYCCCRLEAVLNICDQNVASIYLFICLKCAWEELVGRSWGGRKLGDGVLAVCANGAGGPKGAGAIQWRGGTPTAQRPHVVVSQGSWKDLGSRFQLCPPLSALLLCSHAVSPVGGQDLTWTQGLIHTNLGFLVDVAHGELFLLMVSACRCAGGMVLK